MTGPKQPGTARLSLKKFKFLPKKIVINTKKSDYESFHNVRPCEPIIVKIEGGSEIIIEHL